MPNVFAYDDFRQYLKDAIAERKRASRTFSHRFLLGKLGVTSTGFLANILSGKRNLPGPYVGRLASALGLARKPARYFEILVAFNQAKRLADKERLYQELVAMKPADIKLLEGRELKLFSAWYYVAIRELMRFFPLREDYETLARKLLPTIQPREARKAVDDLLEIGLLERLPDGRMHPARTGTRAPGRIRYRTGECHGRPGLPRPEAGRRDRGDTLPPGHRRNPGPDPADHDQRGRRFLLQGRRRKLPPAVPGRGRQWRFRGFPPDVPGRHHRPPGSQPGAVGGHPGICQVGTFRREARLDRHALRYLPGRGRGIPMGREPAGTYWLKVRQPAGMISGNSRMAQVTIAPGAVTDLPDTLDLITTSLEILSTKIPYLLFEPLRPANGLTADSVFWILNGDRIENEGPSPFQSRITLTETMLDTAGVNVLQIFFHSGDSLYMARRWNITWKKFDPEAMLAFQAVRAVLTATEPDYRGAYLRPTALTFAPVAADPQLGTFRILQSRLLEPEELEYWHWPAVAGGGASAPESLQAVFYDIQSLMPRGCRGRPGSGLTQQILLGDTVTFFLLPDSNRGAVAFRPRTDERFQDLDHVGYFARADWPLGDSTKIPNNVAGWHTLRGSCSTSGRNSPRASMPIPCPQAAPSYSSIRRAQEWPVRRIPAGNSNWRPAPSKN